MEHFDCKDVLVWEILITSVKIDALVELNNEYLTETFNNAVNNLSIMYSSFQTFVENESHPKYPSAFLLMYRRVFLCNNRPLTNTVRIFYG